MIATLAEAASKWGRIEREAEHWPEEASKDTQKRDRRDGDGQGVSSGPAVVRMKPSAGTREHSEGQLIQMGALQSEPDSAQAAGSTYSAGEEIASATSCGAFARLLALRKTRHPFTMPTITASGAQPVRPSGCRSRLCCQRNLSNPATEANI